jgi:hypothetical protein
MAGTNDWYANGSTGFQPVLLLSNIGPTAKPMKTARGVCFRWNALRFFSSVSMVIFRWMKPVIDGALCNIKVILA